MKETVADLSLSEAVEHVVGIVSGITALGILPLEKELLRDALSGRSVDLSEDRDIEDLARLLLSPSLRLSLARIARAHAIPDAGPEILDELRDNLSELSVIVRALTEDGPDAKPDDTAGRSDSLIRGACRNALDRVEEIVARMMRGES